MKTPICLLLCAVMLFLSGCENKKNNNRTDSPHEIQSSDMISKELDSIDIIDLNKNEIIKLTDSYSNFHASDETYVKIPKNAPVLEYVAKTDTSQNFKEYYNAFLEIFKYTFPEKKIDERYLFYTGGSSREDYDDQGNQTRYYNLVKDYKQKLESGEEGSVNLLYDESWYRDITEWTYPICLELGSSIGYGYAVINKGKSVELYGKKHYDDIGGKMVANGADRYPLLESFDPIDCFETIKTYPPDSDESYNLLDGKCKIKDAVQYFEKYVNNIPYPKNNNLNTQVVEVDVLKVNDNTYGYYFITSKNYHGITFDYMRSGTEMNTKSDYSYAGGNAFMIESNDIDIIYGYYKLQLMDSIKLYDKIISFEDALKTTSSSLTSEVRFEIKKIEFVYNEKPYITNDGYIQTENGEPRNVSPSWKFTLFNPNDNKYYRCYVNAINGDFRYFITLQEQ